MDKEMPDNAGKVYATRKEINAKAEMFKQFFLSPVSPTFMNVLQSALRAGYSQTYSENISVQRPKWWIELTETADYQRAAMLKAAQSALLETVTTESNDKDDRKLKHDASKFISERLGKDHFSVRQELTGADGRRLIPNETRDSLKMPLSTLFKGISAPQ